MKEQKLNNKMPKVRHNKGITLIALIITIVVLLILAVVTIGAIKNSKIITHSQKASNDYTVAQEKEQIQLALSEWQLQKNTQGNTQTFKRVMESELSSSATVGGEDDGPITITFKKTENVYKVTNDGNITEYGKVTSLEKYIFGRNLEGKNFLELLYEDDEENFKNVADEELGIEKDSITIIDNSDLEGNIFYFYIQYKECVYKLKIEIDNYSYTTVPEYGLVEIYNLKETKAGKKVSYDNKLWTILYDDNENGLQMICDKVSSYNNDKFYLGVNDSLIDWDTVTDIELNKNDGLKKFMYSYNRAIETLNTACENLFKDEEGNYKNSNIIDVRCVGSNPTNKNAENATPYTSENLAKWPTSNPGIANNKAYSSDNNYIFDYERMKILGTTIGYDTNNTACDYWLASRRCYDSDGSNHVYFEIYEGRDSGGCGSDYMSMVGPSICDWGSHGNYLRPVVKLKSDVQFSGSGTEANPYTFAE